ncbi:TPA: hypothetical protein I7791_05740 [Vibrio vulnificus]|nr:hypothetical protein [Vibrio vulnificus]
MRVDKKTNRKFFVFFLIICFLSIINVIAFDVILNLSRDNLHYNNFYQELKEGSSFGHSYIRYENLTGAKEPFFFIFMYFFASLGVDYSTAILVMNILLSAVLALSVAKANLKNQALIFILFYLSTDYYLFVLFSEAHRLKLGVVFLLVSFLIVRKNTFRYYFSLLIMSLSHFQTSILAYFSVARLSFLRVIVVTLFFAVLFSIFSGIVLDKISYYFAINDVVESVSSTGFLIVLFLLLNVVVLKVRNGKYIAFLFFLLFLSAMLGKMRINIIVFELSMFYLFLGVDGLRKKDLPPYFLVGFFVFSTAIFNIFKIFVQYTHLMEI